MDICKDLEDFTLIVELISRESLLMVLLKLVMDFLYIQMGHIILEELIKMLQMAKVNSITEMEDSSTKDSF